MTDEVSADGPRYKHDCDQCVYLGRAWHVDLYFHGSNVRALQTVVARQSDEPSDYESGIGMPSMGLYEATRRAVARGLLEADSLKVYG